MPSKDKKMKSLLLEEMYPRIFHSAVVAIGVTNFEGKYIIVNPTWCSLLGYTAEEATHLSVNDVTPEEDWDTSDTNFDYLVSDAGRSIRKKRRYQRHDGSIFWADLHASTLYDDDNQVLGLLGVFISIEKQMQAEQKQRELYQSLEILNNDLALANTNLAHLARRDPLTNLYNRRVLEEVMSKESTRSERTKRGFGIAIADIDDFKKINDTYGHDCGDKVLVELSKIFLAGIRSTDTMGRWGGEEFLFVFTETSCQGALIVIERIRQKIEQTPILCEAKDINVTITMGLSYHQGEMNCKEMIAEADKAMYRGKRAGKNKVLCFQNVCSEEE